MVVPGGFGRVCDRCGGGGPRAEASARPGLSRPSPDGFAVDPRVACSVGCRSPRTPAGEVAFAASARAANRGRGRPGDCGTGSGERGPGMGPGGGGPGGSPLCPGDRHRGHDLGPTLPAGPGADRGRAGAHPGAGPSERAAPHPRQPSAPRPRQPPGAARTHRGRGITARERPSLAGCRRGRTSPHAHRPHPGRLRRTSSRSASWPPRRRGGSVRGAGGGHARNPSSARRRERRGAATRALAADASRCSRTEDRSPRHTAGAHRERSFLGSARSRAR